MKDLMWEAANRIKPIGNAQHGVDCVSLVGVLPSPQQVTSGITKGGCLAPTCSKRFKYCV